MIGIYEIERIYSVNGTLSIVRSDNERTKRCSFTTYDPVHEWDEIFVENDYEIKLFAGILESPEIDKTDNITRYKADTRGYKKLFDRLKVQGSYDEELAGDIIKDIVADFAPGFTTEDVEDGAEISKVLYNYVLPSEAIDRIAKAIGYRWGIDPYKVVSFNATDATPAPEEINSTNSFFKNLKFTLDVSNLCNVVIVRGGTYLSEEVVYTEVADGEKTQFVLPEKPHDVSVFVNGVEKSVGIKFGQQAPTEEFQINFNEKYIENGTFATLADGDVLEVFYTYDVPIRVRRKDLASVAALRVLFPETNGEFEKVIQDPDIKTRELAYDIAQQNLNVGSNAIVDGSFETEEDIFSYGQLLTINVPEFIGNAVIQQITSKQIAGGHWKHNVQFATVLFGFEDFMRTLLAAKKVELIDGETLETSTELFEDIGFTEVVTVSIDENRQTDGVGADDSLDADINVAIIYGLAPYFPPTHGDGTRVFIMDGSPLA